MGELLAHITKLERYQKMQRTIPKKLVVGFLSALILATTPFEVNAVTIKGAQSCGVWVQDREAKNIAVQAWLIGYLSGVAVATQQDFLHGKDLPSLSLWVDNFCRANPLKDVEDAASVLGKELMKQKR